jgi:hypothetical protein
LIRRLGRPKASPTAAAMSPDARKTSRMLTCGKAVVSLKAE